MAAQPQYLFAAWKVCMCDACIRILWNFGQCLPLCLSAGLRLPRWMTITNTHQHTTKKTRARTQYRPHEARTHERSRTHASRARNIMLACSEIQEIQIKPHSLRVVCECERARPAQSRSLDQGERASLNLNGFSVPALRGVRCAVPVSRSAVKPANVRASERVPNTHTHMHAQV